MNPTKIMTQGKYKYDLDRCPKNPNRKKAAVKEYRAKNNLTTMQGRPIFSAFHVY